MRTVLHFKDVAFHDGHCMDHALILFPNVGMLNLWFNPERQFNLEAENNSFNSLYLGWNILEHFEGGTSAIAISFTVPYRGHFLKWCESNHLEVYDGSESI